MAIVILLGGKYLWILAWILQSIGYYFVLKAMKEDIAKIINEELDKLEKEEKTEEKEQKDEKKEA